MDPNVCPTPFGVPTTLSAFEKAHSIGFMDQLPRLLRPVGAYSIVTRPMTTARTSAWVRFVTSSFWKMAAKWFLVVLGLM